MTKVKRVWPADESALLETTVKTEMETHGFVDFEKLYDLFPTRNFSSIDSRLGYLKIKYRRKPKEGAKVPKEWTKEEDNRLMGKVYHEMSYKGFVTTQELADLLPGRTLPSIRFRLIRSKVKYTLHDNYTGESTRPWNYDSPKSIREKVAQADEKLKGRVHYESLAI